MPHPNEVTARQSSRIGLDVRWGVWQAVLYTAVMWIPATLVFLVSGAVLRSAERHEFGRYAGAYLLLAVLGGAVLGFGRRAAARSRWGAAAVGGWIGAQSLLLGCLFAGTVRLREGGPVTFVAFVGALGGAGLGLWFRARAEVWAARVREIEQAP